MDVSPQPNAYHCHADGCSFDEIFTEVNVDVRLPTKEELNLYRKYTRELRLLGTNISDYGRK